MKAAGIEWHPRRYHQRFSLLATLWDVLVGMIFGLIIVKQHKVAVVHARSYVPALMAVLIKGFTGVRFIFDMRGFWVDERVDGGLWRRDSRLFRVAKWFESLFLNRSDHIVSLTHAAKNEILERLIESDASIPITVIPTCVDLAKFCRSGPPSVDNTLGYVGSVGTWYLFEEAIQVFKSLMKSDPTARFLILNRADHQYIQEALRRAHIPESAYTLVSATHDEVPVYLAQMNMAVCFFRQAYSKLASSPTRLGELLACGIPCLSNTGVGDVQETLAWRGGGVTVSNFEAVTLDGALKNLLSLSENPETAAQCRSTAQHFYSLESGVKKYAEIYRTLGGSAT